MTDPDSYCWRTKMKTREVTEYICETCGGVYSDEQDAKDCEGSHKIWVGHEKLIYQPFAPYPEHLKIDFSDGTRQVYRRVLEEC